MASSFLSLRLSPPLASPCQCLLATLRSLPPNHSESSRTSSLLGSPNPFCLGLAIAGTAAEGVPLAPLQEGSVAHPSTKFSKSCPSPSAGQPIKKWQKWGNGVRISGFAEDASLQPPLLLLADRRGKGRGRNARERESGRWTESLPCPKASKEE